MAIVVTGNCQDCRFTECVSVCPVACFHGDTDRLYIDPNVCIECRACVPVCPVHAICDADELPPEGKLHWLTINAEKAAVLPSVEVQQKPLPTAQALRTKLGF